LLLIFDPEPPYYNQPGSIQASALHVLQVESIPAVP